MSSKNLEFDLENKSGYKTGRPFLKNASLVPKKNLSIIIMSVYYFIDIGPTFLHSCFLENS